MAKSIEELAQERIMEQNGAGPNTAAAEHEEEEDDNSGGGSGNEPTPVVTPDPIPVEPVKVVEPIVAEPKPWDPDQVTDEEFQKILEKRSGGKLKDWSEVEDRLNNYIKPANERLRKANEYAEKAGDELAYYKSQGTDWKTVPAENLVKDQIKSDYPEGLTEDVIDAIMADKYHTEDDPDSMEYKIGQANLKKDAESIRTGKIAEQIQLQTPPEDKKQADAVIAAQKATEEWTRRVDTNLKEFKGLKIDLGDGETFTHVPKNANFLEGLKTALADTRTLAVLAETNPARYSGKDGVQKIIEDVYFLENKDSIIKDAIIATKDGKMNAFVDKNLQGARKNNQPPNGGAPAKDIRTQVAEKLAKARNAG